MRPNILSLLAFLVAENVCAQEIAVEALDGGRFRLSFFSASVVDLEVAQERFRPAAAQLCNGAVPVFGRYNFSSREAIVDDGVVEGQSFTFEQEISCTSAAALSERPTDVPPALSSEEAVEAERRVRAMSIEYFEDIGNERYEEAYAVVADSLREFATAESWKVSKQAFHSDVGAPISITIARVTVYYNPPNAPTPGLYVAADFNNQFELAPIHCGYLVWFRGDNGEFQITREETGHVTAESLAEIPSGKIPVIRQRLRCIELQIRR